MDALQIGQTQLFPEEPEPLGQVFNMATSSGEGDGSWMDAVPQTLPYDLDPPMPSMTPCHTPNHQSLAERWGMLPQGDSQFIPDTDLAQCFASADPYLQQEVPVQILDSDEEAGQPDRSLQQAGVHQQPGGMHLLQLQLQQHQVYQQEMQQRKLQQIEMQRQLQMQQHEIDMELIRRQTQIETQHQWEQQQLLHQYQAMSWDSMQHELMMGQNEILQQHEMMRQLEQQQQQHEIQLNVDEAKLEF